MNLIEHKRAKFAYDKVKEIIDSYNNSSDEEEKKKKKKKEFKSWATKFPTMISTCGLLQAVTFYKEKNKEELYKILNDWLIESGLIGNNVNLLTHLTQLNDFKEYIKIEIESIKFLTWVKRFASILGG